MKKKTICQAISAVLLASALPSSPVFAENTITDAIKNGEAHLNLRLRYEDVDQSNTADKNASALTLKTQINYKTASYQGITAFIELDDVSAYDGDKYNSTINGNTNKAVIADPEGTEVNQAWINYNNWNTDFKWGRQRINLDNQRFVGGVGFRQNEQTYDAFSVNNTSLTDTTIFLANINNVNRIFGEDSAGGDHESDTNLVNIKYSGLAAGTLTGYAYLIDNEDFNRFSTDTIGIRFSGKSGDLSYTLEYATQEDSNNNALSYDADYWLLEGGYSVADINFKAGYEVLGSDSGDAAFITPLATLHKFQGWTDQFLVTPKEGITDLYLSAGTVFRGVNVSAVLHSFTSDEDNIAGDDDLGNEFGLVVGKKFDNYSLNLKYASYSAGDNSFGKSDTDKLWFTATAAF